MSPDDLGGWSVLTAHQAQVARRAIDQESARREHVVVYLSGAHAYGFPSVDSDLDLKAVHVLPTTAILGLDPPPAAKERIEIVDGVEVDYSSNEIGSVLKGLLRGSGNYLERVLGACTLVASADLDALREVARGTLSRCYYRHYRGFSEGQRRELRARPTVKRLLYVLRTALTGAHLLRTGELITDLTRLCDRYGFEETHALVERKRSGERAPLDPAELAGLAPLLDRAFAALDAAHAESPLPEEPQNARAAETWLLALRRARFGPS